MSTDLVRRLRERAAFAREEKTATAISDALYFEEAADEIERIANNRGLRPTRDDLARHLAALDNIRLLDIRSTVGPAEDANNWREYLGRADDLLAFISAEMPS